MKKLLLFTFLIGVLSGCSGPLNQPIFEPLDPKDLNKQTEKGNISLAEYGMIQMQVNIHKESTNADHKKITYNEMIDYYRHINDTTLLNVFKISVLNNHDLRYNDYNNKVDSLIKHYKQYKLDNSLTKYVSIKFDALYNEYYPYIGGIKNVNIGFKITPLKGVIEQLIFTYEYKAKIQDYYSRPNRCLDSSPIRSAKTSYWKVDYLSNDSFGSMSAKEVKRDYEFKIEIEKIKINGKVMSVEDLNIPESISNYLDCSGDDEATSLYKDIIIELIDKDYMSFDEYYEQQKEVRNEKYNPIVYSFIDLSAKNVMQNMFKNIFE